MLKSRQIKNKTIIVDDTKYIYSVIEYSNDIQIRIYISKRPILNLHLSYPESWGIDVFRPKTIEILIQYFNKYYISACGTMELWLFQEKELFNIYLEHYFSDGDMPTKNHYLKHIAEDPHKNNI